MSVRRGGLVLMCGVVLLGACDTSEQGNDGGTVGSSAAGAPRSSEPSSTGPRPGASSTSSSTTAPPTSTTTTTATTVVTTSTTPVTTTTTIAPPTTITTTTLPQAPPPLAVYDPACVVQVAPAESLTVITERIPDEIVTPETVQAENGLIDDVIQPGQLLDVCVGNGLNDITGEQRTEPNAAVTSLATRLNVEMQQRKLNELFAGYGISELLVDGISGPVTRQRLCAFRLAMGLPVSTTDMAAGSDEEAWLEVMTFLPVPPTSARESERWILIDRTCQIMFVGAGPDQIAYVFPTSTGMPEFPTRDQDRTRAYRYNPESANAGWHDSTTFPAADDNPLNGNMYKPLYFDRGQAIHGALNVPTSPQSHGCARLRVAHQDLLIAWLGLGDVDQPLGSANRINVTVTVQGEFVYP